MYLSRPLQSVLQQQSRVVDNGKFVETTPAAVRNGSKKRFGREYRIQENHFFFFLSFSLLEIIKTRKTDRFPATHLQRKSFENIPLALFYF
jgi:hypothetical protein